MLSWLDKPLAPAEQYVHLVGYGQHQIHREITECPQKSNRESKRQDQAAGVVERFRLPFVRGFGCDDHPIVYRRIKS
jgi:hypothetical protein